jgi:hypothetical protein
MSAQACTRWVVVYAHDGQPVEGWMYVHKHKAEQQVQNAKPSKYRVEEVCIVPKRLMDHLLACAEAA